MNENRLKPSKKALPAVFASKAFGVETTGIEPATSGLQSQPHRVPSENLSDVAATGSGRCTNGCTSKPEKARRSRSKVGSDAAPAAAVQPGDGDFTKALLMITSLPLSDADKAEAVRRWLSTKEQHG